MLTASFTTSSRRGLGGGLVFHSSRATARISNTPCRLRARLILRRRVSPNFLVARAPVISFTDMTVGHFSGGSGVFDLLGQSQSLTIAL